MLPMFVAPIAFVAMLVAPLRICLSRDLASQPSLQNKVYAVLSIVVVLYGIIFYVAQNEAVKLPLMFAIPIMVPLGLALVVAVFKTSVDRLTSD